MTRFRILAAGLLALLLLAPAAKAPASGFHASVDVSFFVSELSAWGRWVYDPEWGTVWAPDDVGPGWQPYLYGRWAFTDYGWSWISDDPWSPYPWHYGTWVFSARWGWVWVPGSVWAPAWVTWCWTDGYVGWAPVSATFVLNFSGPTRAWDPVSSSSFVFVPARAFASGDVRSSRVDVSRNADLVRSSRRSADFTVAGGIVRTQGPPPETIQRAAGVPIRRASIRDARVSPARAPEEVVRSRARVPVVAPPAQRAQAGRAFLAKGQRGREGAGPPRERERSGASRGDRRPEHPPEVRVPAPREPGNRHDRAALARRDEPRTAPPPRIHERPAPPPQARERSAPRAQLREPPAAPPPTRFRDRPAVPQARDQGGAGREEPAAPPPRPVQDRTPHDRGQGTAAHGRTRDRQEPPG